MLLRILFTLSLGSVGGLLFAWIHSPLPWLLGALVMTVACIFLGMDRLWIPPWFRQFGLIVIGISLGLRMTPQILQTMTDHIGLMLLATVMTVLFSLGNAWIFHKIGKVDGITAIFSNIPGGLSEMVTVGQTVGGNQQIITIFHSIRAVMVVLCTPYVVMGLPHHTSSTLLFGGGEGLGIGQTLLLLAVGVLGAMAASRCSVPSPYLLGALLVTALLTMNTTLLGEHPALPGDLMKAAQVFIGVSIGLNFKREDVIRQRQFFAFGLAHSLLLFVLVIGTAVGLSYMTSTDALTNILATVPGGLAEMSLTAMSTGADPILVTAFQLFRLLFVLFLFSFGVRIWINRHRSVEIRQQSRQRVS